MGREREEGEGRCTKVMISMKRQKAKKIPKSILMVVLLAQIVVVERRWRGWVDVGSTDMRQR